MQQRWAAIAVVIGLLVLAKAGRADEAEAVKAIEKLGGKVEVDYKQPGKPVVSVEFRGVRHELTDEGLKHLKGLKSLQSLDLSSTQITDEGLKHLKDLRICSLWCFLPQYPSHGRGLKGVEGIQKSADTQPLRNTSHGGGLEGVEGIQEFADLEPWNCSDYRCRAERVEGIQESADDPPYDSPDNGCGSKGTPDGVTEP